MGSLLQSTRNTRALPTGTMRYIRSDAPVNLTEKEIQWLSDHHITTIVDLRSDEELVKKPCELKGRDGFRYFHLPVTGGSDIPKSLEHLYIVYRQMIDDNMEKIIHTIMDSKSNVMYFCTAGKDRTGVVSAIILKRLGFSDEAIIDDYMKSKDNLMDMLTEYASAHPEIDIEVIIPHRENMARLLNQINTDNAHVTDDTDEELQRKYYLVQFIVLQEEYYTFWYTDDIDGFLLDANGFVKSFPTKENAIAFAKEKGFLLDTDALIISSSILRNMNIRKIKCSLFLNYWNTFSDLAHSINCPFIGDEREKEIIQHTYEKLFYGCNILVKEDEEHYRPKWNKKERRWIAKVMRDGFKIVSKGLNTNK